MPNIRLTVRFNRPALAALILVLGAATTARAQDSATYEIVANFTISFQAGRTPSSVQQAADGSLYGTATAGGTFDMGTLFRLDPAGAITTLHHFSGAADGGQPYGLVKASDGRFYGATRAGTSSGANTVFSVTPEGTFSTLHTFGTEGAPVDMFAASDGNAYALLERGGEFGNGVIFMFDAAGAAQALHSIPTSAGISPSSFIKGTDGRFYVTTLRGGAADRGTLFAIDDAGTITILHEFGTSEGDGSQPIGLTQARDGRLYGTTRRGGTTGPPPATVYAVDLGGQYQLLHTFQTVVQLIGSDLREASDGYFYGFANSMFRVAPGGPATFLSGGPSATQVIEGADGRLYGASSIGGVDVGGQIVAFDLSAGTWTTLYTFTVGANGAGTGRPHGVIQVRDGRLYGSTSGIPRPAAPNGRAGTLFAIDAVGAITTMHSFTSAFTGGSWGAPMGNLFEAADGSVYGTRFGLGGGEPAGQLYRLSPGGVVTTVFGDWSLQHGVIQARDGRLYGVTGDRISPLMGGVFRVEASGAQTIMHRFDGTAGAYPSGELVEIADGRLLGATEGGSVYTVPGGPAVSFTPGTIFAIDPANGAFANLYTFPSGVRPVGRLTQGTDGLIYGTTMNGGTFGLGTIFSLDAAGTLSTLHHFGGADGANPAAGVIQGSDGRFYGTTRNGGAAGVGTLFVINVGGGLRTLHHFAMNDGATPVAELIQATDGAVYGTATAGGPQGGGVVFRLRLETTPPPTAGYFQIVSRNSDKCLDVYGASTDAVAQVIQWTCNGGANQQWRLEPAGGGAYRVIARHSGQALDVFGALLDDTTPVVQYPVTGGDNQAWTLEPASDGYVRFVAMHSGKAMDVEYASTADGARVVQYTPHGNANQQWLLRAVP